MTLGLQKVWDDEVFFLCCGILIPKVHTNGKIEDLFLKAENYVIFTDIQNSYKKGNCNSIPF